MPTRMERLEQIVDRLPESVRVDIEAWGGEPTFRVGGKNFVFASPDASSISVKLPPGKPPRCSPRTPTPFRPATGSAATAGCRSASPGARAPPAGVRSRSGYAPPTA